MTSIPTHQVPAQSSFFTWRYVEGLGVYMFKCFGPKGPYGRSCGVHSVEPAFFEINRAALLSMGCIEAHYEVRP
jgi:hypothetical protein